MSRNAPDNSEPRPGLVRYRVFASLWIVFGVWFISSGRVLIGIGWVLIGLAYMFTGIIRQRRIGPPAEIDGRSKSK